MITGQAQQSSAVPVRLSLELPVDAVAVIVSVVSTFVSNAHNTTQADHAQTKAKDNSKASKRVFKDDNRNMIN